MGAGQSVGLLQFDGYYSSDVQGYWNSYIHTNPLYSGLTMPTLTIVAVDGGVTTSGSGNSEVCLDIEMVMSMAPGVSTIYVYEAPNPSPWVDLLSKMANDNLAKQLSCSWGGGSPDAAAEVIFQQMATQGSRFSTPQEIRTRSPVRSPFPRKVRTSHKSAARRRRLPVRADPIVPKLSGTATTASAAAAESARRIRSPRGSRASA